MMNSIKLKKNMVFRIIIFVLAFIIILMSIALNDKTYRLTQKSKELSDANGTISEYSSAIEKHKKTESELQSEIDSFKKENESLKKQMTELAAKKKAAGGATVTSSAVPAGASSKPDKDEKERVLALTKALTRPDKAVQNPPAKNKVCYLTFDDGPSKNTPAILDTLKKNNIKATFFVIGTGNLSILKRIDKEGHTIGLHSNCHKYSNIYTSVEAYLNDLLAISQKVEAQTGKKVNILRFPGGSSNAVSAKYKRGIMSELTERMPNMGYSYFDWNVDSGDADKVCNEMQTIINKTVSGCTGKGSACILMHDANAKTTTVEALPVIIEKLKAMGYKFEPLTASTYGYHQSLNN